MSSKSDYLRFSANSIKELITRKLTADTQFTDQIYEGSNLAILMRGLPILLCAYYLMLIKKEKYTNTFISSLFKVIPPFCIFL